MKLLKIERPATKHLKIARILFMLMTVLFAAYMLPMCYDDFIMTSNKIQITQEGGYEYVWTGVLTIEAAVYLISLIYYTAASVAALILCLRTTSAANCTAFGLGAAGALLALFINSGLSEFMVYRYGILSFLYDSSEPFADWYVWIKPVFVLLMLASAAYFLLACRQEWKLARINEQDAVTE